MPYAKALKGGTVLASSEFASLLFGLLKVAIIVRSISIADFGAYSLVLATALLVSSFVMPQFSGVVLKFYPAYKKEGDGKLGRFIFSSLAVTAGLSLVFFAGYVVFAESIARLLFGKPFLLSYLGVSAFLVLAFPLRSVAYNFIMSMERFKLAAVLRLGHAVSVLAFTLIALALNTGVLGLLTAAVLGEALLAFINVVPLFRHMVFSMPSFEKQLLRYWTPIGLATLVKLPTLRIPTIVLGSILSLEAVAFYSVSEKIASTVFSMLSPYINAVTVVLMNIYEQSRQTFQRYLDSSIRHVSIASLMGAGVIGILAEPTLDVVYGSLYAEAAPLLALVLIGHALSQSNFFQRIILYSARKTWLYFLGGPISLVLQVAYLVAFVGGFGLLGAGYASVALSATLLVIAYLFTKLAREPVNLKHVFGPPLAFALAAAFSSDVVLHLPQLWLNAAIFIAVFSVSLFVARLILPREIAFVLGKARRRGRFM